MTGSWAEVAAVASGVAAGACYAVGTVLQQRTARAVPWDRALRPGLLAELAGRRAWLAGIAISVASFGLQALALTLGPLALVEPLIITDLLFALPLTAHLAGVRLGRREWAGAGLVVAGLASFLVSAHPSAGITEPGLASWVEVSLGVSVLAGLAVALAPRRPSIRRTTLLACAAGLSLGLMAALTKAFTGLLARRGLPGMLSWQPLALAAVGAVALLLSQSAFQAGPLAVSLPIIDVLEPVVAVLVGVTVFRERLAGSALTLLGEVVGVGAVLAGITVLDRSPLVLRAQHLPVVASAGGPEGPPPQGAALPSGTPG